ncbi:MAG: ATP-binding protein [Deltaproteobacteria bacterium]|nr:ATP-binding protein [Myxococcales bacterium]MDP3215347.1 ATP-binding protein [Deltaproteobacteria bacterium]
MNADALRALLQAVPLESEWLECKVANDDPKVIGEYVSALSNSAALLRRDGAWLIWGIDDATRRVVGTAIRPRERKVGNEPLESWLAHKLSPRVDLQFHEVEMDGRRVVALWIQPTFASPVSFDGVEWIRVGEVKKRLREHPGREKELWAALARQPFETGLAARGVTGDEVLSRLDYPKYFELARLNLPANRSGILDRLTVEKLIVAQGGDRFDVTHLGAVLFARQLSDFAGLGRKAFRVIRYRGVGRVETLHERLSTHGYASDFEALVDYVNGLVPTNEVLGDAFRRDFQMYPKVAIRELVANAMVHQDFAISGTGPMLEIFDDRMEVSNPGLPLIDPLRFIDHSPQSRNEMLADLMRRLSICEERGSGFDKVIDAIEAFQLPPPDIRKDTTHTRVLLFALQEPARMDRMDRVRACYQHCCLLYVSNRRMTNATLRERLKIDASNPSAASRIIRDAVEACLVKPEDPDSRSRKHARYVPFWA